MEIDERQPRCLVQRTIDIITKSCNANYSGFSRFPHGPVVNKFYCPASYVYYVWTRLSLSLGSTVARDLMTGSQLSGGRHSPVTLDTMWSAATAAIFCCFDDRLITTPNIRIGPVTFGGCQLNSIDVDQRLAATFIEQRLAGDATII